VSSSTSTAEIENSAIDAKQRQTTIGLSLSSLQQHRQAEAALPGEHLSTVWQAKSTLTHDCSISTIKNVDENFKFSDITKFLNLFRIKHLNYRYNYKPLRTSVNFACHTTAARGSSLM